MALNYPDSVLMYKTATKPLISLSGECLLKDITVLNLYSTYVGLAPMEQTSILENNFKLEGTDE
jgi:hypothetical protein